MGTLKKTVDTKGDRDKSDNSKQKATSNDNVLIEFTRITEEKHKELKIDVYNYLS